MRYGHYTKYTYEYSTIKLECIQFILPFFQSYLFFSLSQNNASSGLLPFRSIPF